MANVIMIVTIIAYLNIVFNYRCDNECLPSQSDVIQLASEAVLWPSRSSKHLTEITCCAELVMYICVH